MEILHNPHVTRISRDQTLSFPHLKIAPLGGCVPKNCSKWDLRDFSPEIYPVAMVKLSNGREQFQVLWKWLRPLIGRVAERCLHEELTFLG